MPVCHYSFSILILIFLKRCLVHDPRKRATAVELLMDPWIVDIREVAFGTPESNAENASTPTTEDKK